MAITILSSSYTQTSSSVNVTIDFDRTTLIVATNNNNAPTFDGVSLTAGTSLSSDFYWWYYTNPPIGTYSLAANTNTILNYLVLDNVSQTTPLSTQMTVNTSTLNYNGTVYNVQGDNSTPQPAWFGVTDLNYPGGIILVATGLTNGAILNNTNSTFQVATMWIQSVNTTSTAYNITYSNNNPSGAFACPAPAWIWLNNEDIVRDTPQMIII